MKSFSYNYKKISLILIILITLLFFSFSGFTKIETNNTGFNKTNSINFFQPIIQRQQTPKVIIKISEEIKYKVQKNDTLYGIAKKFNISIEVLKKTNKLKDNSILKIGTILIIASNNFIVYSPSDSFNLKLKTDKILLIYSQSSIIFSPLSSGIVGYVGNISGFGKSVIIQNGDYYVVISNLQEIFVEKGQNVNLQTCIGFSPVDNILNLSVFYKEKMLSLKELLIK